MRKGKISGEFNAIDLLSKLGATEITFIIFMPTKGTRFENCEAPLTKDVKSIIEYAKKKIPKVSLGCMRPRRIYDLIAIDAGIDAIVLPSKDAVEYCKEKDFDISYQDGCCSL